MFLIDSYRYAEAGGGAASYADEVLADSPLGYWRLGESSGTVAEDSSGNDYDGEYGNSPTLGVTGLIAGDADTAVEFDSAGNQQHVQLRDNSDAMEVLTEGSIEFWFQLTDDAVNSFLFQSRNAANDRMYIAYLAADDKIYFFIEGTSGDQLYYSSTQTITGTDPHHVVIVQPANGGGPLIYIDGTEGSAASINEDPDLFFADIPNPTQFTIGLYSTLESDAIIDEFAIYGTALSSTRVSAHYNAGT